MLVGDQQRRDAVGRNRDCLEAAFDLPAAQPRVDQQADLGGFKKDRVAATAAPQDVNLEAHPPRPFRQQLSR